MKAFQAIMLAMFLTAVTASSASGECRRLDGPKGAKKEVLVDCAEVLQNNLPLVHERPDMQSLLTATPEKAAEILGKPYHSYNHGGYTTSMYGPEPFISIEFKGEQPITILFNMVGVSSPEEVPAWLGFDFPPPVCFEPLDAVFWLNQRGMRLLEVHNPRYQINGQYIYPVILRLVINDGSVGGAADSGRMSGLFRGGIKPVPCRSAGGG